ncbi:hypothetical protein F4555_001338 [Mobiluncus mulieris]|uniref:Uncharacterized protein n=1 Tax=Mobiluncus mulieris TaxID=2052 RepID=A0A8G2M5P8_9ACTO|nr:hypothetical protein [Mobiluncus mulieris]MBB5846542.1 hypothetical protein [Mobiluncus mulieris]MCV0011703.1 hypothetical protein [Mobiluncus mulieris]STO16982.1 Uncharacterised protein [Mobiluncus mulieris]
MPTKTFRDGEILTAADVNNYLVNDPTALTKAIEETRAAIKEAEAYLAANPPGPHLDYGRILYIFAKKYKSFRKGRQPELKEDGLIIFPEFCEVLLYRNPGGNISIERNIVRITGDLDDGGEISAIFKIHF